MTILDALAVGYRDTLAAVPYGENSTLISLPATFASGALLTVLVTLENSMASVSDRGVTAEMLGDYGLDLSSPRVNRSFKAVRNSIGLPPMFGAEDWEISAFVDASDIAIGVQAVADAAMRADGLRVLTQQARHQTFSDISIERISRRAAVVPRAKMLGAHGETRQVTLSYPGQDSGDYYVQALSGRDSDARQRSYDHASGLFISAAPDHTHRVALLQTGSWDNWQVKNLESVCRVVLEENADEFIAATAA